MGRHMERILLGERVSQTRAGRCWMPHSHKNRSLAQAGFYANEGLQVTFREGGPRQGSRRGFEDAGV